MANPLVSGGVSPNSATNPQNPVFNSAPTTARQKNNLPMVQQILFTPRFGEIYPSFVFNQVPNDDLLVASKFKIETLPMGTPMLSDVRFHRASFAVPKAAIYSNTWSKCFVNPKKGDDVPADVYALFNPTVYRNYLKSVLDGLYATAFDNSTNTMAYLLALALAVNFGEEILPTHLGISFHTPNPKFDRVNDFLTSEKWPSASDCTIQMNYVGGASIYVDLSSMLNTYDSGGTLYLGRRAFFYWLLSSNLNISSFVPSSSAKAFLTSSDFKSLYTTLLNMPCTNINLNIERICAYQLGCSQFFTNDDIDDVYTSELYRQNMESLIYIVQGQTLPAFVYNGTYIFYDWCSNKIFTTMYKTFESASKDVNKLHFWQNLFTPCRALRYGDYFNSARTQPLADGDVAVSVTSDKVDPVDMVTGILKARYLNLVNSVRNTVRGYSLAVYGVAPDVEPAEPRFVSHSVQSLNNVMNINSADDQGKMQSNFSATGGSVEFNTHYNQDTITVSVIWFDCMTSYIGTSDRFAVHYDRFDDFIPQLQDIGDQPIHHIELALDAGGSEPFGYANNYSEYKHLVSRSLGGFATNALPGWAMSRRPLALLGTIGQISPDFIRYYPGEFDEFYKSLTGAGAYYFHFIVSVIYDVKASRPMEYVSGILMNS